MDDFETELDKDLPNRRKISVGKNNIILEREDPYGFWTVHYERGAVPDSLRGSYTSPDEAMKLVQAYLNATGKTINTPTTA